MTCSLCNNTNIGDIERLVHSNEMSMNEAAHELDCTYQDAWKHFNKCLVPVENSEQFEMYLGMMRDIVLKLNTRVESLEKVPTDLISVKMITSLTKELRGMIRDLGSLEGRIQSSPLIQLNQVTIKYSKLTSLMFSALCPECQLKLADGLDKIEQAPDLENYR